MTTSYGGRLDRHRHNRIAINRRDAVLRANHGGASYATIASALGISPGNVQQIVAAARTAHASEDAQ